MKEEMDPVDYKIVDQDEAGTILTGKKRGRRPNAQAYVDKSEQEIDEIEHQITRDNELLVIDEKFGGGLTYDANRIVGEICIMVAQTQQAFLEIGRRLILIKEHEGHGQFTSKLEELHFPYKSAQRMMRCALVADSLGDKTDKLSIFNQSKLLEIATLEDSEIKELGEGGSVAGVYLDDLARMTASELQNYTRSLREQHKNEMSALEQVVKKKNEIINKQELQISLRPEPSELEVIDGKLKGLTIHFISECVKLQVAMRQMRDVLDDASRLPGLALYKARLGDFRDEIVRYGTEAVIAEWEELTNEVENLSPKSELPDVPSLG